MTPVVSRRIAQELRDKIVSGQWAVGTRLPSIRDLASTYGVSVNTIQNAFRELEGSNLVERHPRRGGFVKSRGTDDVKPSQAVSMAVIGGFETSFAFNTEDHWIAGIVRGFNQELAEAGYHLSMLSYGSDKDAMLEPVLAHVGNLGSQLAGAMCFLRSGCQPLLDELDRRDIPWITINRASEHALHNFVAHEIFAGARLMGGCFARMNIKRVVVLSDPLETGRSAGDKLFGCIRGYVESGGSVGNVEFVSTKSHTDQAGYEAMAEYLDKGNAPPQAVLCAGDLLAFGGIRACRERGLSMPGDVGFIGTTGLHAAEYCTPTLTVLEAPMQRMGQEVARMLLEMAREGVRRMAGRFVPGKLVMRESFQIPEPILAEVQEMMGRTP